MQIRVEVLLLLVCGRLNAGAGKAVKQEELARLPGAVLLTGYPPFELWMTAPGEILQLQPTAGNVTSGSMHTFYPRITLDGRIVASARVKADDPWRVAIATYSVPEKKWTEYVEGEYEYGVAISPDGRKLAYMDEMKDTNPNLVRHVHINNLKTGEQSTGPEIPWCGHWPYTFSVGLSWSPQSNRLAYSGHPIEVWDMDRNTHWEVADGEMPAWSPDGELIAYRDSETDERTSPVGIVHPDGSGDRILVTLPRENAFVERLVWSPDSKTLLLNRLRDEEGGTVDIQFLDLATLKLKTRFKGVPPVQAWADGNSN